MSSHRALQTGEPSPHSQDEVSAALPGWQDTPGCSLGFRPNTGLAEAESNSVESLSVIEAFAITTLAQDLPEPHCLLSTAPDAGQLSWRPVLPTQPNCPHISTVLVNTSGTGAIQWTALLILRFGLFWLDRW